MSLNNKSKLFKVAKNLARELRKNQTEAEFLLWQKLRNRNFQGVKFNRQFPIFFDLRGKSSFYIADFYCHQFKIIIELDGKIHDYQKRSDAIRVRDINTLGFAVIRFSNNEIINNIDSVLKQISNILAGRKVQKRHK